MNQVHQQNKNREIKGKGSVNCCQIEVMCVPEQETPTLMS